MNPEPAVEVAFSRKTAAGILALFLAVAFLIYFPSLKGPFVFDDIYFILDNPNIALESLSLRGILAAATSGRPLTTLSFALNHLANGYDTAGFHAVNTAIHALTAFFFLFLANRTHVLAGYGKNAGKAAFFASLLFLCHPLATQSVSYISQRANAMCGMFFILSLFLFAGARTKGPGTGRTFLYAGCAAAGLAAFLSKENAATLPFFILLYEWLFFRCADEKWLAAQSMPIAWGILLMTAVAAAVVGRGQVHPGLFAAWAVLAPVAIYMALKRPQAGPLKASTRRMEIILTAFLAAVALAVWVEARPLASIMHDYKNIAPVTCYQRLLTEARVVFLYLGLFLLPLPDLLSLGHDVTVSTGLFSHPSTIAAILALAGIFVYAVKARGKRPVLVFAVFMYFGNLAIESSVLPLHMVFEHRAYLPMIFLCLVFASWIFSKFPRRATAILTVLALLLGFSAFMRNQVWADDLALWQDAAKKAPNDAIAHNNLGIALMKRGKTREAISRFAQAMATDNSLMDAPYNMGLAYREMGRTEDALAMFRRALAIRDDYVFAHNDLGLALMDLGRMREAELHFRKALAWNPYFAKALNNLGTLQLGKGLFSDAVAMFREALKVAPGFVQARINLGIVLLQQGKAKEAAIVLEKAVSDQPGNSEALSQLGNALLHSGDTVGAMSRLRKAVSLDPKNADSVNSLAVALTTQGRNLEAIVEYRKALGLMEKEALALKARSAPGAYSAVFLAPERTAVHKNLALALSRMKQFEKAGEELQKAAALSPTDIDARLGLGSMLAARGLYDRAFEVFASAALDFPENPEAQRDLGRILMKLGRPKEALTAFSRAALLSPTDTGIHRDIATARDLIDKKQTERN